MSAVDFPLTEIYAARNGAVSQVVELAVAVASFFPFPSLPSSL